LQFPLLLFAKQEPLIVILEALSLEPLISRSLNYLFGEKSGACTGEKEMAGR
jgi:hypothetical protein